MMTAMGPVIILENNTAGTPISTVSGSASAKVKPTGIKSAPTCEFMANKDGYDNV